jgi:OOP family OmpA-OmpF porin
MRTRILLFAFALLLAAQPTIGQYEQAKDGIGARLNSINYQWPSLKDDFDRADFTGGMELEYIRHLNNALNLAIPVKLGKANFPANESGAARDGGYASLDAVLQLKYFRERALLNPFLFGGLGFVTENFNRGHFSAPVGLGLNLRLAQHLYLSTKAEYRFGFQDLRDNVQLGAGLQVLLGPGAPEAPKVADRDGDGVPDNLDRCPDIPGLVALQGCPDRDGDGIPDHEDECPDVAGLAAFAGCPDRDGDGVPDKDDECPDEFGPIENRGCPIRDADGDGIPDDQDDCPNEPGPASTRGCPDRDGDGIPDKDDACPDQPGPASTRGCPDRDGDGVPDKDDKCPDTPGPASNQGCPEIQEEDKEVLTFAMSAVQFETGSARLRSNSFAILDKVVDILRRYPDYKLRISGHTDSTGSSAVNQRLSEQRAKACYDYLVSKGIDAVRMSHAGFGQSRPIADNRYKEGRDKNRRTEFDLYLD